MDIKTIISLREKIEDLNLKLKDLNLFEQVLTAFLALLFFCSILSFLLNLFAENYFSSFLNITFSILYFNFLFVVIPFIFKKLLKNKSPLFNFLFFNLHKEIKFDSFIHIEKTLKSLNKEETELLYEVQNIHKKNKNSINNILKEKIFSFAETANEKDINIILDSIQEKELRHKILEIAQKNKKEDLNVVKQKIVKSI